MNSNDKLPSTEATKVDLIALRNWHFKASMDIDRQPEMRRWHRRQADIINRKLHAQAGPKVALIKVAMIEFLAEAYRDKLHAKAQFSTSWDWEEECRLAKIAIAKHEKNRI